MLPISTYSLVLTRRNCTLFCRMMALLALPVPQLLPLDHAAARISRFLRRSCDVKIMMVGVMKLDL